MSRTFFDFFKSFYYSNTYLSPVDFTDQGLSKHLLKKNRRVAIVAQRLISQPEVQRVLSEPLSYDPVKVIPERNAILERHGFKLLSIKCDQAGKSSPFYSVVEHPNLPGWVIKSGAIRVAKEEFIVGVENDRDEMAFFTEEESILRIEMAHRVAKVAKEAKIEVIVPQKKLVAYANLEGVTEVTRKYCVICQKINILSVEETLDALKKMSGNRQREVAQKISTIVQKAGLVDATFNNIRLTPEGKIAIIDTEPVGLMVAKKPGIWNKFFAAKGYSVEKCARVGLYRLMNQTSQAILGPGLKAFHKQIASDYEKVLTPKLSKWKIGLSLASCGLIPVINAIIAIVQMNLFNETWAKVQSIDASFKGRPLAEQRRSLKDYLAERTPIVKQMFAYMEGVPFPHALA